MSISKNLSELQQKLSLNKHDLAFIVGNGINRYAYGDSRKISWEEMLLEIWKKISDKPLNEIPKGISLTEFYDVMEIEAKSIDKTRLSIENSDIIRSKIADYIDKFKPIEYHRLLQKKFSNWNIPLLTTNFDRNLDDGLKLHILHKQKGFTDYYPWNVYFGNNELFSPIEGFGVWHINGMVGYRRSIQLSLSGYTRLSSRVRKFIHSDDDTDNFVNKNIDKWNVYYTWLHIIFNRSLCVMGLALDKDENFLRWLLLERMKYFEKFPKKKKGAWYVYYREEDMPQGKKFFLEYFGFEIIKLDSAEEVYKGVFEL